MDRQVTPRLRYITYSSHSGSTLLSLLLNTHPDIMAIGHTTGWRFAEGDDFRCSCGEPLERCPFYRSVAEACQSAGLSFDVHRTSTSRPISKNSTEFRISSISSQN